MSSATPDRSGSYDDGQIAEWLGRPLGDTDASDSTG